jgi:hypothetical protein
MAQTAKRGQMSVIAEMFKEDGVLGVYQRFPPKGLQQASTRFTYYYMYAFFSRQYLILTKTKQLGFWANLLIGYFVGVVNMIPSNPLELITNVIMVPLYSIAAVLRCLLPTISHLHRTPRSK